MVQEKPQDSVRGIKKLTPGLTRSFEVKDAVSLYTRFQTKLRLHKTKNIRANSLGEDYQRKSVYNLMC